MKNLITVATLALSCALSLAQQDVPYFPAGTFYDDFHPLDAAVISWYSRQLMALREPSLWASSKDVHRHTYRFTWLRAWDAPVAIRVEENDDGTAILILKVTSGSGADQPGQLVRTTTKHLTRDEFAKLSTNFVSLDFWNLPTRAPERGKDGARWILEAAIGGRHHVVDRWSPKGGAIRDVALRLVELSGYNVAKGKLY
jgi:hypothetical protein